MLICAECGHENREGMLFCAKCGYGLTDTTPGGATVPTRRIASDPDENSAKATWGSARFTPGKTIIIHVRDAQEPLTIKPNKRLIFGRADTTSDVSPDIDLAPYGGVEKGVSRQHAAIDVNEDTLMLLDIGSANGTYLNGQKLFPNQPRVLRDGDEVRLGKLVTHIYFK